MLFAVALMVGVVGAAPGSDAPGSKAPDAASPAPVEVLQLAQAPAAAAPKQPAAAAAGPDSFVVVDKLDAAIDRLAQEITAQLPKKKTLLVWVLDQSYSMEERRERIASQIERLYQEVGKAPNARPDELLMGVVSYTAQPQNHTPKPTGKPQEIMAAIRKIKNDDSTTVVEMQCDALASAMENYRRAAQAGGRQLMLVLASDESGDAASNVSKLEATIKLAKERKCIVHVLGSETIFGYPYAYTSWTHQATKSVHRLTSDRGPETAQPEVLQMNGYRRRDDLIASGFGPYEQMRIARETGGIFFLLPSPELKLVGRDAGPPNAEELSQYLPDLSSRDKYAAERDKSKLRKAVYKVIADLNPYQPGDKGSRFEVNMGPLPFDAQFKTVAAAEMKKADDVIRYFEKAQLELEGLAAERAKEQSPRWRANYDLLYAQTVSYQARLKEYGWYMADCVKNPKNGPSMGASRTSGWYVVNVERLFNAAASQALKDKADSLFRTIETEYAGTPWAAWAKSELERGYGIELRVGNDETRGRAGAGAPRF